MYSWEDFYPLPSLTGFFPIFPSPKPPEKDASWTRVAIITFPATEVLILHVVVVQLVALEEVVVLGHGEAVGQRSPKGAGQGARGGVHAGPQLVGSCGQHRVFI